MRPARAEFWCEEHPQRKRERDGSGSGCIRWSTIERQHESCGSVECETKFDLGLEIRLEPEEFEARREGVVELDSNATFIGGVVTNAAERCGDQEIQKMAEMGCEHQTTCMNFVKEQIKTDRFFLFELPWNAGSWQMPEIVEVARMDSVQIAEGKYLCQRDANGEHQWVCQVGDGLDDEQLVSRCYRVTSLLR